MDRDQVRRDIERSKEAFSTKVDLLATRAGQRGQRVRGKLRDARDRLSVRHQYEQHPLAFFAAAGLLGWCAYRVLYHRRAAAAGHEAPGEPARDIVPHPPTRAESLMHRAADSAVRALASAVVSGLVRMVFAVSTRAGKPRALAADR